MLNTYKRIIISLAIATGLFAGVYVYFNRDPIMVNRIRLSKIKHVINRVRDFPTGKYQSQSLPDDVRLPGLLQIYVDSRGAYSLEFASDYPINLNPALVHVEFETSEPERIAKEVCEKSNLILRNEMGVKGWYRATGP
jgi:hypothetical protein